MFFRLSGWLQIHVTKTHPNIWILFKLAEYCSLTNSILGLNEWLRNEWIGSERERDRMKAASSMLIHNIVVNTQPYNGAFHSLLIIVIMAWNCRKWTSLMLEFMWINQQQLIDRNNSNYYFTSHIVVHCILFSCWYFVRLNDWNFMLITFM